MARKRMTADTFTGSSAEMIGRLTKKLGNNVAMFGLFAFGQTHFRDSFSAFHKTLLGVVLNFTKVVIAAPRGHGKSTCLSFLYVIFCIIFKRKHHIIILQNTLAKATGTLSTIKYEVANNELLKVFGVVISKDTQEEAIFDHPCGFSIRVLCKGYEQMGSIRGEKFRAWRPDLVLVDDLEDDKTVQNPDLRAECERYFNDAVDPAIDYKSGGQLVFIGTIIHDDCLLAKLISPNQYFEFKKFRFQARNTASDGTHYALWKEKYSLLDLEKIEADDPIKFAKEYQNDPISGARQQFHETDFRRWNIQNGYAVLYNADGSALSSYSLLDCRAAIGCDLAWSEKKEADDSVLFPALLTPNDEVLLDYYVAKKGMRPDEFEDILFQMVDKYENMTSSVCEVGFEKAMLEKVVKWMLAKAMKVRKRYLVFKELKWDRDKITRIVTTLQPRYVNHTIFHRQGMGGYEHQLLRIPSGTHDDIVDASHSVVKMLKFIKSAKKISKQETEIDWILRKRKQAIKNAKKDFVLGKKDKKYTFPIKTTESYK